MKPRVLFVSGTRYSLPLQGAMARKWEALAEQLDVRVLARGSGDGDPRFALKLPENGILWRVFLSRYVARELRAWKPDAVLAEGPVEAASCLRAREHAGFDVPVVTDIHGDWRTSTRLYGSRLRRLVSGKAERVATKGLRNADGVRTLSRFTSDLVRGVGVEPLAEFPAFIDLSGFEGPRAELPAEPRAAFVGVLERYKGLATLMATWDLVRAELPQARLAMVGTGHANADVQRFVDRSEGTVSWVERLDNEQVAPFLDASTCLFLPSESEGLPRIIMEAFCRGRPVVATRAGGVPDLVRDGENGYVLERGDAEGLASALVRVLGDPEEARRLAAGAAASDGAWRATPEDFATRTRAVVDAVLARREP